MKHSLLRSALQLMSLLGVSHLAQAQLDPSFGNNGRVFTAFSAAPTDKAVAVALQPDGKLIVAGQGREGLELARYTTTGTLDATFGTGGKATFLVPFPSVSPCYHFQASYIPTTVQTYGLCLQTDGKLVVVGSASQTASFVARFLPSGALDTNFGSSGVTYICGGTVSGYAVRVWQESSGGLVVAAHVVGASNQAPGPGRGGFYHLLADGTLDSNGRNGYIRSYLRITDGLMDNAGRVVAVGWEDGYFINNNDFTRQLVLVRLANGELDATFGTDGIATLNQLNNKSFVMGLAIAQMPNGQLLVLGTSQLPFLARFNTNGTLDSSFGTGGTTDLGLTAFDNFPEMSLQADGKIIIVGTINGDFVVRRLLPSGQPDTAYGLNGSVTVNEDVDDKLQDVLVQPDGKIVAVGYAAASARIENRSSRFTVLRLLPTGRALATAAGFNVAATLRAVPNPTTGDQLHVEMDWPTAARESVAVELLSPMGQVVTQTTLGPVGAGELRRVNLAADRALAAGMYVLRARCSTGVVTSKVVLQ
ncbi:MAG TPA: T9SS type A sorting domain-containing protein [Hymenobacter sp.]